MRLFHAVRNLAGASPEVFLQGKLSGAAAAATLLPGFWLFGRMWEFKHFAANLL